MTLLVMWSVIIIAVLGQGTSIYVAVRGKAAGGFLVAGGLLVLNWISIDYIWFMVWYSVYPTYLPGIILLATTIIAIGQLLLFKKR